VVKTLHRAEKMQGHPVVRKHALEDKDLSALISRFGKSTNHNTLLFLSICLTLYHGLMHLGEAVQPDTVTHHNWWKVT
jgi:hypothetical protein